MIAIFALIGETFLQSSGKLLVMATLGLCEPLGRMFEFPGMWNLLARRERQQVGKARVNADPSISDMRNMVWLRIDDKTEIPSRGTFDKSPALDLARGDVLRMESHTPHARDTDLVAVRGAEGVRKGNTIQLVPLPLELGTFCELLETALPG